jgi:sulfonate transport system permease protein
MTGHLLTIQTKYSFSIDLIDNTGEHDCMSAHGRTAAPSATPATGAASVADYGGSSTRTPRRLTRRAGRGEGKSRSSRPWLRWISPLAVLILWQVVSGTGLISTQKLPPPSTLWSTLVSLITTDSPAYGTLQGALAISLERVAIGLAIGGSVGVIVAMIAGLSRFGENAVDPLMQMLRTVPLFGLIPVFIVWFGIGEEPKVLLIALGSSIPLYLNTFAGIRSVDAKLAELGQVLGLRRSELIRHIVLPGALPQILVGLRQSLGIAWLALVVAEQINASAGLGYILTQGEQFLAMNYIFVALLVYCVLGLLTDAIVRLIERRALTWRRGLQV